MSTQPLDEIAKAEYKAGFVTDIESDTIPAGLSEDVVRLISAKKGLCAAGSGRTCWHVEGLSAAADFCK